MFVRKNVFLNAKNAKTQMEHADLSVDAKFSFTMYFS